MAESQDGGSERGFTVVDKRGAAAEEDAETSGGGGAGGERGELPRIDFATFAISLGTSALYHMGLVEDPTSGEPGELNLTLARQTIDTLEMLEQKTRGNLEPDEAQLLENLLYELRMRFVEAGK